MNQTERRLYLIHELLNEQPMYANINIPKDEPGQRNLLRSLLNVRPPAPVSDEFLSIQDEYLQKLNEERGVVRVESLSPTASGFYLWQGDITTLAADAIVNAANSGMTGCYRPMHNCIDNCIHTYAGVQLRNACNEIMLRQGHPEPAGSAKITPAYNLPSRYVIHTVGPIVEGKPSDEDRRLLASCYTSCLRLAEENGLGSIAFCCISTGVFGYPPSDAACAAVAAVREHLLKTRSGIKVIFNVFKDSDLLIYRGLLCGIKE